MAKRKRAKLIVNEGEFQIGYINKKEKKIIEIWKHNKFHYELTKKTRIECNFTDQKEILPKISLWIKDINNIYGNSKLNLKIEEVI